MTASPIKDFTDLLVWQKSRDFVVVVYKITSRFPKEEIFGLTSQIRRAAVSVPSNIAEGFARFSPKEKIQFYSIAHASLVEAQNQLIIAKEIRHLSEKDFEVVYNISVSVRRLLSAFIRSSRNNFRSKSQILNSTHHAI